MGRRPCCSKEGLNRGAWTAIEDKILVSYINTHGEGKWRDVPQRAGLKRCGKSCRLRWLNYLRPDIKRGNISHEEEELIIRLHKLLGNRWSLIAGRLPGRTDNEIKNYWNTTLGKKVESQRTRPKTNQTRPNHRVITTDPIVVRTKAVRCTKGFFADAHLIPQTETNHQIQDTEALQTDLLMHETERVLQGSENSERREDDLSLSSAMSFDGNLLFGEEIVMGDWREMDLEALSSFLDSDGEWLNFNLE